MSPTPAAALPRVTPTASMSVRIPWGHVLEQFIANEKHVIENLANVGVTTALHALPWGGVVSMFLGPQTVSQYVDMALTALGSELDTLTIEVPGGTILATAANLINDALPATVAKLGDTLMPMLVAELAKRGIKV